MIVLDQDGVIETETVVESATGEYSIEAWVVPANVSQEGPARIISYSAGTAERNFTLGQEKGAFDVRFRTSGTSTNGLPSLRADNEARTQLTHVVYTRDAQGVANLYVDGNLVLTKMVAGDLSAWDDYGFALGNEMTGDRPWLGELHLVAIFDRALSADEIALNFEQF